MEKVILIKMNSSYRQDAQVFLLLDGWFQGLLLYLQNKKEKFEFLNLKKICSK